MFLGYAQKHMGGTYHMLNLRTKCIVLSHDIIWLNKTYSEYVSRQEYTKSDSYILQSEYESHKWYQVNIDNFKTEHIKIQQKFKTGQDYRSNKT